MLVVGGTHSDQKHAFLILWCNGGRAFVFFVALLGFFFSPRCFLAGRLSSEGTVLLVRIGCQCLKDIAWLFKGIVTLEFAGKGLRQGNCCVRVCVARIRTGRESSREAIGCEECRSLLPRPSAIQERSLRNRCNPRRRWWCVKGSAVALTASRVVHVLLKGWAGF